MPVQYLSPLFLPQMLILCAVCSVGPILSAFTQCPLLRQRQIADVAYLMYWAFKPCTMLAILYALTFPPSTYCQKRAALLLSIKYL